MMHCLSRFIFLFKRNGKCFLYASLSNSFAELDSDVYEQLCTAQKNTNSINLENFDEDVVEQLRKMKVVDVDDEMEINRLKSNILLQRYNPYHLSLTINPTLACNFACPYCFESSHKPLYMTDEVEDSIITFIKNHKSVNHLHITWFGGEPLLAFERIISLSKKMLDLKLDYYNAGMISNGYLLTRDKMALFDELKISSVQITIDGSEQTHNSRRFKKDGSPTYKTILQNIDEAQKYYPNIIISIRVNVDKTNSEEFYDVLRYFRSKKYPNVYVYPGFVNDISGNDSNKCIYNNEAIAAFLTEAYKKYDYNSKFFYPSGLVRVCGTRSPNSIVVGPLGELYKCWNDVGNFSRSYGYINGKMTNEAVLYEYLVKADHLNDSQCNACKFFPVCDGGCPYNRIQNEKAGREQNTCSLFKEHTEDFLMLRYDYRKRQDNDKN